MALTALRGFPYGWVLWSGNRVFRNILGREMWIDRRFSFSLFLPAFMSKRVCLRFPFRWSSFMLLIV